MAEQGSRKMAEHVNSWLLASSSALYMQQIQTNFFYLMGIPLLQLEKPDTFCPNNF
jgi:hypothetical protein